MLTLSTSDTSIYPPETGFYYLNSRYYSPEFGRFINADGIIDNRGLITQNLFAYCGNNPVNNYDPSGNFFISGTIGVFTGIGIVLIGIIAILTVNQTAEIVKNVVELASNITNTNDESVYILTDPNDSDEVKYVGRTNDPERRKQEHNKHEVKKGYDMTVVATGLSKRGARIAEQTIISAYTLDKLDNMRREIAVGKLPNFEDELGDIIALYGSITEDELMNLMGR